MSRVREIEWFRYGAILAAIVAIFLLAYLAGRLRDEIWPAVSPADYTRASAAAINEDWGQYLRLRQRDSFLGILSPARWRGHELKASLVGAADTMMDAYYNGSDPSPESVDWAKAELCLRHAAEVDPDDRTIAGKLALCDGYVLMLRNPKLPGAARSEAAFKRAAARLPKSPEPHLALARLYVYSYVNAGRAMAEFYQADRLGFHFGPREIEEEGDAYLLRAESELRQAQRSGTAGRTDDKNLRLAHDDLGRARNYYEPISGFSNVSVSLNRLDQDETQWQRLEPPDPSSHYREQFSAECDHEAAESLEVAVDQWP